jgi:hypothetical protein
MAKRHNQAAERRPRRTKLGKVRIDMILRELTKRGDKVKVTFVLPADDKRDDIFVAGDFNAWNPGATKLRRRGDVRTASVTLAAGRRYSFRYYRHAEWFNDDHADDHELNDYGGKNGILDLTKA